MTSSPDIVDIPGLRRPTPAPESKTGKPRQFLSIWFRCCHVYGRLYKNASQTSYNGGCPRCATRARVMIRPDGTTRRCFQALS
ncbi:MAG: hypothetical protein MK089_00690 [Phycisphaerales bacterium]|nr:hypothetical protein [Phycisphaerae bacterium]MCH2151842.1 hypothetical protein [Phycisphaerales bacterium]